MSIVKSRTHTYIIKAILAVTISIVNPFDFIFCYFYNVLILVGLCIFVHSNIS